MRTLPHSQRQLVEGLTKGMLDQGNIQESNSPWNSPLFLVPEKDGTLRPVIDFWRVNEVTVDGHYPLSVLRNLLMCLWRGNKVFSYSDLLSGYWQLPMAPESREVTAFSTPNGHFEWTRMPFWFKGSTAHLSADHEQYIWDHVGELCILLPRWYHYCE